MSSIVKQWDNLIKSRRGGGTKTFSSVFERRKKFGGLPAGDNSHRQQRNKSQNISVDLMGDWLENKAPVGVLW